MQPRTSRPTPSGAIRAALASAVADISDALDASVADTLLDRALRAYETGVPATLADIRSIVQLRNLVGHDVGELSDTLEGVRRRLRERLREGGVWCDDLDDAISRVLQLAAVAVAEPHGGAERARAVLEEILRKLPVGVSITDARTGQGLFHNDEAIRLTEHTAETRRGLDDYERYGAIHPDGRSYAARDYPTVRAITAGEVVLDEEMLYRLTDGRVLTLLVSSRPLRGDDGRIERAVTSVADITELAAARRELRQIADSVPIHLVLVDRAQKILFINASAATMWGGTPDQLIGRTIAEAIGPDQARALAPYAERVFSGETVSYEHLFTTATGARQTFLNTYSPFRDARGAIVGFVATGTDISDRKHAEEALRSTVDELRLERELREHFIAALSHDLRTPLASASMGAELLAQVASDPDHVRRIATRMRATMQRADELIRNLLDVQLLRARGALPIDPAPTDLVELTRRTLEELASIHGDRFVLDAPASVVGSWDGTALRRVLENLCGNAVKYGARDVPVTVTVTDDDGHVRVTVHNAGDAIPEAELPFLFDAFRRARHGADGRVGWGLGLALVKGLVQAHGGTVAVSSDVGHGTTFTLELPRS